MYDWLLDLKRELFDELKEYVNKAAVKIQENINLTSEAVRQLKEKAQTTEVGMIVRRSLKKIQGKARVVQNKNGNSCEMIWESFTDKNYILGKRILEALTVIEKKTERESKKHKRLLYVVTM